MPVVAPGNQIRSFTYIDDIVEGIILTGEKGHGDGYCLGTIESYTVKEVAEMFEGEIFMLPERPGDRKTMAIDLTKSKKLGWEAKVSVKDEINKFISNL